MAKLLIVTKSVPQGHIVQDVVEFPNVTYAEDAISTFAKMTQSKQETGIQVHVFRLYDPDKGGKDDNRRYLNTLER